MAKPTINASSNPSSRSVSLPLILETVFTLSKLTVLLVGIIVMVVTFANGNPYWVAMLRGGVTVLCLGLLVWFISWLISKGVIESARLMLKEVDERDTEINSNDMDTNA